MKSVMLITFIQTESCIKKMKFRAQRESFAKVAKDAKDSSCPEAALAKVGNKNDTMGHSVFLLRCY
jgi:hypothetical protein